MAPVVKLQAIVDEMDTLSLAPGKTVLIHAAAGGMGLSLVQWAKHLGAFVIGTTSNKTKAQRVLALGADAVIDYTREDFVQRVKEFTAGRGADLIIDGVGKTTFVGDLEAVATRGHIVTYGITGGMPDNINPFELLYRSRTVHGADLFDYIANRQERLARANVVWEAIAAGWLKPQISQVLALEDAIADYVRTRAHDCVLPLSPSPHHPITPSPHQQQSRKPRGETLTCTLTPSPLVISP